MIRPRTIKGILMFYTSIGLVSIIAVAFFAMNAVSGYMKHEIVDKSAKMIEVLTSSINSSLEHPLEDLQSLKDMLESNETSLAQGQLLDILVKNRKYFVRLQVADLAGRVTHLAPYDEEFKDIDVSRQEYFVKTLYEKSPYWSSAMLSAQMDKPFVSLSIKINKGVITAFLHPESILSEVQDLVNLSKSYITITDRNGVYIVHPDQKKVLERVNDPEFNTLRKNYTGGIFETTETVNGREMLVYGELIESLGWMIKVYQSVDNALIPVKKIMIYLGILSLLVIIVFATVTARYISKVGKSLGNIIDSTVLIADGNYKAEISSTEFEDLNSVIDSFNHMSASLFQRERELKNVNRELQTQIERISHAEQAFKTLIESTSGRYGQEYLDNLVKEIAVWFNVEIVMVSLFDYKTFKANTLAMYKEGELVEHFTYPISGSPCEEASKKGFRYYSDSVQKIFPQSQTLKDYDIEGYLGTAMVNSTGNVKGVICALSKNGLEISEWGQDLMEIIASKTVAEIERMEADKSIRASLEEKDIMLKEIHHRVKNNMQVVIGLLSMQLESANPEVVSQITESINRIFVMSLVHQKLYQSKDLTRVDFGGYVETLVQNIKDTSQIEKNVFTEIDVEDMGFELEHLIPIGLIVNELVTNSLKYAFENTAKPLLKISMKHSENGRVMTVADNGSGFPPGFDPEKEDTLGLQLVESLAQSLNGKMYIESFGSGALVKIIFQS